jgi:hypothetical protein
MIRNRRINSNFYYQFEYIQYLSVLNPQIRHSDDKFFKRRVLFLGYNAKQSV